MLRDGTVSGLFTVDDFVYPPGGHVGDRVSNHKFDKVLHLVRHPLGTIASLLRLDRPHFWHWTQYHTGLSYDELGKLEYAAHFWVKWTKLADKHTSNVVRLEDINDWWPKLASELGVECGPIPHIGASGAKRLSWDALKGTAVREHARRYGYAD